MSNEYIDTVLQKLISDSNLNLSNEQLQIISNTMSICMTGYNLVKIETLPVPYDSDMTEVYNYLCRKKIKGLSENTLKNYSFVLKKFVSTVHKPLNEVRDYDILTFIESFETIRNCSKSRKNNIRIILNGFFKYLNETGRIPSNPMTSIERIKYKKKTREHLSPIEIITLRDNCKTIKERAIFEFFLSTGCRVSEVENCKISDINFSTNEIKVTGKGDKERIVLLNETAKHYLQLYLETREDNNPSVFVSDRKPYSSMHKTGLEALVKKLGERCLDRNIYCHLLRHTFATILLQHGIPVDQIKILMGHSSIETTLIYAKTNINQVKSNYDSLFIM